MLARGGRVLWRAVRDEPKIFTLALMGSCLFGALVIAQAFVVGEIIGGPVADAFGESGELNNAVLAIAAAILIGMSLGRVVGILGRRLGSGFMMFAQQARYRRRVTRRYLELPVAWHQRHATGTLLSNANADVESAWFPLAPLPFAVGTVFMLVGAVGMLFATDWALALVGIVVFPLLFALNVFFSRRMAPRAALAQQMRAEVSAIAHESFDGALVVKTMGGEERETGRFAQQSARLRDSMIQVGRLRGLFDPLVESVPFVGTLLALFIGALRMRQGAIELADMVAVAFLFTVLAFPVRAIGWVLGDLPRSVAGWDRVARVLSARGEMPYGSATFDNGHRAPGTLRFSGVSFGYAAAGSSAGAADDMSAHGAAGRQTVLHDVDLTVPAGRTVALVGPTGSGKSTITALAGRLVDPDQGQITLDGIDLRELSQAALTDAVALAQQVAFVFDDTVEANVSLDRPGIAEREVCAALDVAQADGFVRRLPDGIGTQLGERGTSLSGGQKQRLALARALAGYPRLLILDDATSAVDPRIEARILGSLRERAEATSVLVVAYRLATITLADEVIYLERGRVVAHGQHTELLASVPGYRDLVTAYERAEEERKREHAYDDEEVLAG